MRKDRREAVLIWAMLLCFGAFAVAGGCNPAQEYVRADAATFDAIAPVYSEMVTASDWTAVEKRIHHGLIVQWGARIEAAKETTDVDAE